MKKQILISCCIAGMLGACSKNGNVSDDVNSSSKTGAKLSEVYLKDKATYPVGAAVRQSILSNTNNTAYRGIVYNHYDRLTAVTSMSLWGVNNNAKDVYTWSSADWVVGYAKNTGKKVHGHALAWDDYGKPGTWLASWSPSSADFDTWMKNYIETNIKHYNTSWPGVVHSWDVVNEAFDSSGIQTGNIYYAKLGASYISKAFQYAHAVDANAKLFMTDHSVEYNTSKRWHFLQTATNLKNSGIPIHGVGLQMHISLGYNNPTGKGHITALLREAAATGLLVFISELDVAIENLPANSSPTAAQLQAQADLFGYVVGQYNTLVPNAQKWGISTWDVSDKDTWKPGQFPLLFDVNYNKKPAYTSFFNALQ